jgi:hypothetical protein
MCIEIAGRILPNLSASCLELLPNNSLDLRLVTGRGMTGDQTR